MIVKKIVLPVFLAAFVLAGAGAQQGRGGGAQQGGTAQQGRGGAQPSGTAQPGGAAQPSGTAQQGAAQPAAAAAQGRAAVEITFTFTKQTGSGSNQYAVWIEDAQGRYVRTLFATQFTATGGYTRRPNALVRWVRQSGLSSMNATQVNAISGATPTQNGAQTVRWDGTDSRGQQVPNGEYKIFLEGTLRDTNSVLYQAPIRLGSGAANPEPQREYTGSDTATRRMIDAVSVRVLR